MLLNKIYNKSCEKMEELGDESIDLVVSSPPYANLRDYSVWATYQDYLKFIENVAVECFRVLKPGCWICWNVQESIPVPPTDDCERYSEALAVDSINIFRNVGFKYEKGATWYKGPGTATQRLLSSYPRPGLILLSGLTEQIILMRKWRNGYKKEVSEEIKNKSLLTKKEWSDWSVDLWRINPESSKRIGHPAPYPLEIPYRLIRMFSYYGDVVLDPFSGSGTTALAAKQCGRNYIGYEIHQEYIDIFNARLRSSFDMFANV